jgi:hypothetical protein
LTGEGEEKNDREEGRRVLLLVVTRELVTFWAGRRRIWGMTLVYVFFFSQNETAAHDSTHTGAELEEKSP